MTSNKPKVLVVGATGKVGRATIGYLQELQETEVVAAVRNETKKAAFEKEGIATVVFDLERPESYAPALDGIDRALLLTGYTVDMLRQSKRFVDTAKEKNVKHIVHIGASTAPTAEVPHWGWHQMVEAYIEKHGFSFTHLRPEAFMQNVTGPGFKWLNDSVISHFVGSAKWSWVDCDDVALVAAHALNSPEKYNGKTIPLGYDSMTFDEVAKVLSEATGKNITAKAVAPEEFRKGAIDSGMDPAYVNSVYTQFKLNNIDGIPDAEKTFDNFYEITGRLPTKWKAFAEKHIDLIQ